MIAVVVLATYSPETRTITSLSTSTSTVTSTVTSIKSATVTDTVASYTTVTVNATQSSTSSQTQTETPQTSTSVSCTVSGGGGPLIVRVETDQGVPVRNQELNATQTGPSINGQSCGTAVISPVFTNSTGWVELPSAGTLPYAGSFSIHFVYSGMSYNGTVGIEPLTTTYLIFYVPSGQVSTVNCILNTCPTMTDSMTMDG